MEQPAGQNITVTSDLPQTDPAQDALGYAPFARRLAKAILETASPQGLVLAVHGPWGAGKTTVVNFIKHYLSEVPEEGRPLLLDFNPWWFTSKEHLADQFLANLRSKLINESEKVRLAGDLLGEYAGAIGATIGLSHGAPWLAKPIAFALRLFKRIRKTVPELKAEVAAKLSNGPRIVIFVDDIDRLVPEEICELFKVVKAIADFPNVIYVLSFDREVVANALNVALHTQGEAYLEKIVQASFTLPAADRFMLRKMLFSELDAILASSPMSIFDPTHWANVYYEGLDHYIVTPRDIVRMVNVLRVTYPAVAGEVNAVDFIALEMLRVFDPKVYSTIRDHRSMFLDRAGDQAHEKEARKAFHTKWLDHVQETRRGRIENLVHRLFPHVAVAFGRMGYGGGQWRKELRVSASQIFEVYFQFGITPQTVSRAELESLISMAEDDPMKAREVMRNAATIRRGDGSSKARELLERLEDVSENLSPTSAKGLLKAIFDVGDDLFTSADESGFAVPNLWMMRWAAEHLLTRVGNEKERVLLDLVASGRALGLITYIIDIVEDPHCPPESPLADIGDVVLRELQRVYCARLTAVEPKELLEEVEFYLVVDRWHKWAGDDSVRKKLQPVWESPELLPVFLEKYVQYSTQWSTHNVIAKRTPRLDPRTVEPVVPLDFLEIRVKQLSNTPSLTELQKTAVTLFLEGMEGIRLGGNPSSATE